MNEELSVGAFEREKERIAAILASADDEDALLPASPGWTIASLADHVHALIAQAGSDEPEAAPDGAAAGEEPSVPPVPRMEVSDRLEDTSGGLLFMAGGPVSRSRFHHLVMHRVDLELALGLPVSPVEPSVAVAGIEDFLASADLSLLPWDELGLGDSMTIHLHATDVDGAEWTIDTGAGTFARSHLKADVALRGPAWALDRWCCGRLSVAEASPLDSLEHFGDVSAAERWPRRRLGECG